ncbi:MAG: response regulator [Candidatus Magnetoovum sp. WYHC-5]|nr:response regulator [Candidatus Magnetoovum sp. WYHC-5]
MKIMIVDDDNTTRKILGLYLKGNGYGTVFAENGLDAIEKLASNEVNMIITDLNMPFMDGLELVRTLKTDPMMSALPILMITTDEDEVEKEEILSAGADGYLVKPVTAESVVKCIESIMSKAGHNKPSKNDIDGGIL